MARTAELLAGSDDPVLRARLQNHIETFLQTLEASVPALESPARRIELETKASRNYGTYAPAVLNVIEALRRGTLRRCQNTSAKQELSRS